MLVDVEWAPDGATGDASAEAADMVPGIWHLSFQARTPGPEGYEQVFRLVDQYGERSARYRSGDGTVVTVWAE